MDTDTEKVFFELQENIASAVQSGNFTSTLRRSSAQLNASATAAATVTDSAASPFTVQFPLAPSPSPSSGSAPGPPPSAIQVRLSIEESILIAVVVGTVSIALVCVAILMKLFYCPSIARDRKTDTEDPTAEAGGRADSVEQTRDAAEVDLDVDLDAVSVSFIASRSMSNEQ
jgi:hypothetical protein